MPDYRSGAGIALGLTMLGGGIGSMIAAKKRKKALEEFLKTFPEQQQPFAGKKISELAAVLGGVGQAMPIPEHMGQNALPFSPTPTLRPDQMQQLTPPGVINQQNAQLAKAKALVRSGLPQGIEMGMNMLAPSVGKPPTVTSVSNGYVVSGLGEPYFVSTSEADEKLPDLVDFYNEKTGRMERTTKPNLLLMMKEKGSIPSEKPQPPKFEYQAVVNEAKTKATGTPVKEMWQRRTDTGGQWENTGLVTDVNMSTQVTSTLPPWMKGPILNKFVEQASQASDAAGRLQMVASALQPDFLTYLGKFGGTMGSIIAKVSPDLLPGRAKEWMGDKAVFEQNVNSNVNLYIKEITGAQMSYLEVDRLMLAIANLKDDPVTFARKLQNGIDTLNAAKEKKLAILRAYQNTGADPQWVIDQAERAAADYLRGVYSDISGGGEEEQPDWATPVE